VYVVEGEKDVHALESLGAVATCSPMGAGKWHKVDPSPLYGGTVVVIEDKDEPGRRHAEDVLRSLHGHATVSIVAPAEGKDAADHIAAGHGLAEFQPVESTRDLALEAAQALALEVEREAFRIRVREAARAKVDNEKAGRTDLPGWCH
jgi:DNA primase